MQIEFLSHFFNNDLTCYNNEKNVKIDPYKNNEIKVELAGHCGTHIDFPFHVNDKGKNINDYDAEYFISYKSYLVEVSTEENYISFEDLKNVPSDVEFLIIKTNRFEVRTDANYAINNIGIGDETAKFIRSHFNSLRIIGIDSISINAYKDKEPGRKAHKVFLSQEPEILIIEDMKLDQAHEGWISKITVAPLLLEKADGTPVTIIAEM